MAVRPCPTCGSAMDSRRRYCQRSCYPTCAADGCAKPSSYAGLCSMHYSRQRRHGDLGCRVRGVNDGPCSVEDCLEPMRKRGWCAGHYAQWHRYGDVRPFAYKWAPEKRCLVCGTTGWEGKGRRFCSQACQQVWHRHGGAPANPECARCGQEIDLAISGKGRRKRADSKMCARCRAGHERRWPTPGELAARDGLACGICGDPVDLTARRPDLMRPSVDHIMPRARGGTDDPENFQLAHLWCNQVKSDRIPEPSVGRIGGVPL